MIGGCCFDHWIQVCTSSLRTSCRRRVFCWGTCNICASGAPWEHWEVKMRRQVLLVHMKPRKRDSWREHAGRHTCTCSSQVTNPQASEKVLLKWTNIWANTRLQWRGRQHYQFMAADKNVAFERLALLGQSNSGGPQVTLAFHSTLCAPGLRSCWLISCFQPPIPIPSERQSVGPWRRSSSALEYHNVV